MYKKDFDYQSAWMRRGRKARLKYLAAMSELFGGMDATAKGRPVRNDGADSARHVDDRKEPYILRRS